MKKHINSERGLTLVELLAAIAISSIILLLILNVHLLGQNQYKEQSTKAERLYDVAYVAKVVTKEIRKAVHAETDGNKNLILNKGLPNEIIFKEENNQILFNGSILAQGTVSFDKTGKKIKVTIESKDKKKNVATEIYMR